MIGYDSYFKIKDKQLSLIDKNGDEEKIVLVDGKPQFTTRRYNRLQKKVIEVFIQYAIELDKLKDNHAEILIPTANFENFTLGMCYDLSYLDKIVDETILYVVLHPTEWYDRFFSSISFAKNKNETLQDFKNRVKEFMTTSTNL